MTVEALDALLDAAKQAGHVASIVEVGQRHYSVPIVACEWCGAHAAANTVSEKWVRGPCAYLNATEAQRAAVDRLRQRDYAQVDLKHDPLSVHLREDGWVRVTGRVMPHTTREGKRFENFDAYFAPDAKVQHTYDSMDYAHREAKLPPYIRSAAEQAVNLAVNYHMALARGQAARLADKYAPADAEHIVFGSLDEHLERELEAYEEEVRESVEGLVWAAFVRPTDHKDRSIADFTDWTEGRQEAAAERDYERRMEGW